MMLNNLFVQILLAAGLTYFCLILLTRYASSLRLIAHPGEHRHHSHPTPMVGGLAILLASVFTLTVFSENANVGILLCLVCIATVGAIDDAFQLPAVFRFAVQAGVAYLMVELTGVSLLTLGNLVSESELALGSWEIPLTIFAVVGVINAINMSDGMDGLAGSLVSFVMITLIMLGAKEVNLIWVFLGCLIVFLVFNSRIVFAQAKIYLGDSGSNFLGLLLGFLLIQNTQGDHAVIYPVTALWIVALPLIDAVTVLLVRPLRGKSPFSADRIHYHHQLLEKGLSVNKTLLAVVLIQIAMTGFGLYLQYSGAPQHISFYLFLTVFVLYFLYLLRRSGKAV
jgi:UDP-GlcNAc:undecaprenyl-phosphate GlcNAc-1-phosphate transferase